MTITLQRITSNDKGTFGVLLNDDFPFMTTLELPWRDNRHDISCIPAGTYECKKIFSNAFHKELFVLSNVPGRDYIEMHIGNTLSNTHGCILLGTGFSVDGKILYSADAFKSFMALMPSDGFTLVIKGALYGKVSYV